MKYVSPTLLQNCHCRVKYVSLTLYESITFKSNTCHKHFFLIVLFTLNTVTLYKNIMFVSNARHQHINQTCHIIKKYLKKFHVCFKYMLYSIKIKKIPNHVEKLQFSLTHFSTNSPSSHIFHFLSQHPWF